MKLPPSAPARTAEWQDDARQALTVIGLAVGDIADPETREAVAQSVQRVEAALGRAALAGAEVPSPVCLHHIRCDGCTRALLGVETPDTLCRTTGESRCGLRSLRLALALAAAGFLQRAADAESRRAAPQTP